MAIGQKSQPTPAQYTAPAENASNPNLIVTYSATAVLVPSSRSSTAYAGDNAWEGEGPLKGQLLKGDRLTGAFPDGGKRYLPVSDAWGNWWILDIDGVNVLRADNGASRDVYLDTATEQALWADVDAGGMSAQGWQNWTGLIPSNSRPLENQSQFQGGAFVHDEVGDDYTATGGRNEGKRLNYMSTGMYLFPPDDSTAPVMGAIADDNPYIDGIPVKLPVAAADAQDFGGWVLCRGNRWTRRLVIVSLWYGGWGSNSVYHDKLFSADALEAAVLKTIAGILAIIVGVLCIVGTLGGCSAAGVGLIITGGSTIISAWYDFQKALDAHRKAIDDTTKMGGSLDKSTSQYAGLLDAAQKQGDSAHKTPSGVPKLLKDGKTYVIGAAVVVALLA